VTDTFLAAVVFYASLMGLEAPPVFDRENLPGLTEARAVFDGYGWFVERDKGSLLYVLSDKKRLALHEVCHIAVWEGREKRMGDCERKYGRATR
jgi:hypothetical protein